MWRSSFSWIKILHIPFTNIFESSLNKKSCSTNLLSLWICFFFYIYGYLHRCRDTMNVPVFCCYFCVLAIAFLSSRSLFLHKWSSPRPYSRGLYIRMHDAQFFDNYSIEFEIFLPQVWISFSSTNSCRVFPLLVLVVEIVDIVNSITSTTAIGTSTLSSTLTLASISLACLVCLGFLLSSWVVV